MVECVSYGLINYINESQLQQFNLGLIVNNNHHEFFLSNLKKLGKIMKQTKLMKRFKGGRIDLYINNEMSIEEKDQVEIILKFVFQINKNKELSDIQYHIVGEFKDE